MITKQTIAREDVTNKANGTYWTNRSYGPNRNFASFGCLLLLWLMAMGAFAQAQVIIGGNVYGGGNSADVDGNTTVVVKGGDMTKVFGGARMANVGGRSFVNIYGEEATSDIFIVEVYGGNDIAGIIGASGEETTVPTELTDVLGEGETKETNPEKNAIDNTWKTFVRTSRSAKGDGSEKNAIIIGALFGGGNGDFEYEQSEPVDGKVTHNIYNRGDRSTYIAQKVTPEGDVGFQKPEVSKTYLEIKGGCIAHLYGGGNNATVTENTTISIDNQSDDLETQATAHAASSGSSVEEVLRYLVGKVQLSTFQSDYSSWKFNFARIFGGNNRAEMSIRPIWNLQRGKIRDLYSGGNMGRMTSETGLLLDINPVNSSDLVINNVFGGCRMADVRPKTSVWNPSLKNPVTGTLGDYEDATSVNKEPGYFFPPNFAARLLIRGGDINNVYGGNDIQGKVYFGNAVGVATSIKGNIYGGGNGAYAYTDNEELEGDPKYGDYWYPTAGYNSSAEALNAIRPNAEQVSIMVRGDAENPNNPTIIGGSIFCGGNCATLEANPAHANLDNYPLAELKIGTNVIADNVFLGNNGRGMVEESVLTQYASDVEEMGAGENVQKFSSMELKDPSTMETYMEGAAMDIIPRLVFEDAAKGDRATYQPYSSYIGSFFCGGNVGSMTYEGKDTMDFSAPIYIYNKVVGGCNDAFVPARAGLNAFYQGGILGSASERDSYTDGEGNIKDRLEMNFNGLRIRPMRRNHVYTPVANGTTLTEGKEYHTSNIPFHGETIISDGTEVASPEHPYYELTSLGTGLEWNTVKWNPAIKGFTATGSTGTDDDRRLYDGNVYGGCYNSGIVNGNVTINVNQKLVEKDVLFASGEGKPNVDYESQRDDLMDVAMAVMGGGCGEQTEMWGSTTVNLNKGAAFLVYGGGEKGIVGKSDTRDYDPAYSTTVNLKGSKTIYSSDAVDDDVAEAEYIFGGGNQGNVYGNTYVNLGNGRIYDAFGGASNADIQGHTEVYIGRQPDGAGGYKAGFPWVRDNIYGGSDFGGIIWGQYADGYDYESRISSSDVLASIHGTPTNASPGVLKASAYVEYDQGRVDSIFGGGYAQYDYADTEYYGEGATMPSFEGSFVNIRPASNENNELHAVFGGGSGYPRNRDGDMSQDRSYVLVDIQKDGEKEVENFKDLEIFGAGSFNGMGMSLNKEVAADPATADMASVIIDLMNGKVGNVYGGSYNEGITRRTVINVPAQSAINIGNIFGGAYGTQVLPPCDVYESHVNYNNTSEKARVNGAIYGGNNNERRTLYTHVNISSPVWSDKDKGYLAKVYGAGYNIDTWSEYTEVNLLSGAKVYEAYGGGNMGHVLNAESVQKYMQLYKDHPSHQISTQDPYWSTENIWASEGVLNDEYMDKWTKDWENAWTMGDYYTPNEDYTNYIDNEATNLDNTQPGLIRTAEMDDRDYSGYTTEEKAKRYQKYNTNVIINEGATVVNYAYGGGYGQAETHLSGDVYGNTYIALLGGTVTKDIYAAGTAGAVNDLFGVGKYDASENPNGFTATANAYVGGGSCRNVYGGGWLGNVGMHSGAISDSPAGDIPGETHVVIGDLSGTSFTEGIPTVQRNAYGGGEGGAVFGTANLTLNKGYVGYQYVDGRYVEKIEDNTKPTPNTFLTDAGCLFGGGYIDNSSVDKTCVNIYGGHVRGSAFGGGEVAAIGRGSVSRSTVGGKTTLTLDGIYRPGKTRIEMYGGQVHRNVYGGGRGTDNLGGHGSLNCDGYVFGQTEVHIHGGEIGTVSGLADGDGNVFGGGDEGFVYSAYEKADGTFGIGKKDGVRYDPLYQGYYYEYENGNFVTEQVETGTYTAEEAEAYNTEHASDPGHVDVSEGDKKYETERRFTEDCKVLIEPSMKVLSDVTINGHDYVAGDYVPTSDLNTLPNKNADSRWESLDDTGIIIHNAVFAGGNTPSGSLTTGANISTVYGNATASISDIFHRDMITLGTRHTGGLYGDGNLTLVDGYRELNITNYGTDYYSIEKEIGIDTYHALPDREADYYELKYTCLKVCQDKEGTRYKPVEKDGSGNVISKASTITADEMQNLFVTKDESGNKVSVRDGGTAILKYDEETGEWVPNKAAGYWKESGVLPVYAGRLMNSIQRADFCGVFGSRMVMQGAQDRVPEEADYTDYTINRVREVSLNKKTEGGVDHGNYFGIYNIVNYLGALTSDVDFGAVRKTDNPDAATYKSDITIDESTYAYQSAGATYSNWKQAHIKDRTRNNGSSHNKVALASGVYLELTTEESTGLGLHEKVWGPITGVVELDLINVAPGIGGGFVYAKNVHGVRSATGHRNTTLTSLNKGAVTHWDYTYSTTEDAAHQKEWESSGNFVHSTQTIIDDCYNISNRYMGEGKMPAHYWYIKGSVYVYDQYISAYTGSSNAFSETVEIPLTIAAASHGKMKLLNVMPNRYAFYASPGVEIGSGKRIVINDKSYYKNDPISYWDWYLLSPSEKELFIEKTYVNCMTCKIDGVEYAAGTYIMSDTQFATYKNSSHTYTDTENKPIEKADKVPADDDYIFRTSNNVSHDQGYILTYEVNNPGIWDNWYTPKADDYTKKKTLLEYAGMDVATKATYDDGPTYRLDPTKVTTDGIVLGQRDYKQGELITKSVEDAYQAIPAKPSSPVQATFEKAYIVTSKITVTTDGRDTHYNPGVAVSETFAEAHEGSVAEAYICTSSISLTKEDILYKDSKMTKAEAEGYVSDTETKMNALKAGASALTLDAIKALEPAGGFTAEDKKSLVQLATLREELKTHLVPAYYCTGAGKYGGAYYEKDKNYRGLEAWSSMSGSDRAKFVFNYDALDLLIDPTYSNPEGEKYQYDGNYTTEAQVKNASTGNKAGYSLTQSVDYTATYNDSENDLTLTTGVTVKHSNGTIENNQTTLVEGDELEREVFESLPNEQRHFAPIAATTAGTYYVANTDFQVGATPYAIGETISRETYEGLPEKGNVTVLTVDEEHKGTYYYCRESYPMGVTITPVASSAITGAGGGISAGNVLVGTLITSGQYNLLPNQQKHFTIHGVSPTETSTLYVSRESDIYDLSKEKIVTVIYQYDYDETDGSDNVTPISERHILNIHLTFKSGVPTVEKITKPDIILPGDFTSLREPAVTPGAYEITGGGWELFETQRDAESHTNGVEYTPAFDPLYWYQDEWYVAYYAKSYLGRTYSNAVPVSVANYHDLAEVMADGNKEHHMYIDNKNVKRESKIYINDYSGSGKNGLDLFKNLYDLSLRTEVATSGDLKDHAPLDEHVRAGDNLQFFLRADISREDNPEVADEWTPIASGVSQPCFEGVLHGDGHTVSGLDNSLFGKLCGSVYNLGVTGSFTSAGVADTGKGYVESCWVKTTGTPDGSVKAVFGNPTAAANYKQVVNSYCQTGKTYSTTDTDKHGLATAMSEQAFYNGTLAYDLNNFYLYKRFCDQAGDGAFGAEPVFYNYWLPDNVELQEGRYARNEALCSSGYNGIQYVEDRFQDGDFRYAAGSIPGSEDVRHYVDTEDNDKEYWFPIWPDDYLFFGQALNYGHVDGISHQDVPTAVNRSGGRVDRTENGNRVYRAPAYFRSKTMDVAHFNSNAVFAQSKKDDAATIAYKNMTAIDFTGYNDMYGTDGANKPYKLGWDSGKFYAPLLDDDGLSGFKNIDLTKNLLVYSAQPGSTAAGITGTTVSTYLTEPEYEESADGYRSVEWQDPQTIHGHWLQKTEEGFMARRDQLLVDLNDFNAPIAYTFHSDKHMWYQRTPEDNEFVDFSTGWQGISLPFTSEMVTTSQKGEITHFYDGSENSKDERGAKIGHEYWLRQYRDIGGVSEPEAVRTARFTYPTKSDGAIMQKTKQYDAEVTNTFLWDYYYNWGLGHNQKDHNRDTYQEYYRHERQYQNYPMLTAGIPYLIGFPGKTYFEFDLSGSFSANTTASPNPATLDKQTITFVSQKNISIGVSDDEMTGITNAGFVFKPSYMNIGLEAGTNSYALNTDGDQFDKVPVSGDDTNVGAFRPYFLATGGSAKEFRHETRAIRFYNDGIGDLHPQDEQNDEGATHRLEIFVRGKDIYTVSHMEESIDIRIVSASGALINAYTLEPGKTVITPVTASGVYIVNRRKLSVKVE